MQIVTAIFPVFAIAITGYLTTWAGIFNERDIQGISRFVFNLALPVLLFNALYDLELPPDINWQFLLSYYLVVLLIFGLSAGLGRFQFTLSPRQQGVFAIGASYSNLGLVGLPVITIGLGDQALLPLLTIISLHPGILWFIGTVVTERADLSASDGRSTNSRSIPGSRVLSTGWHAIKSLSRNPIIIGLVLGLIFNRLPQILPPVITDTLDLFGQTSIPCALFVLGGSLAVFRLEPGNNDKSNPTNSGSNNDEKVETAILIILKLAVQPLLVWLLASGLFHLNPLWTAVAVMAAGMPIGINAYIFAQKYRECLRVVGTAVLLSTLLAAATQTLLLALFINTV